MEETVEKQMKEIKLTDLSSDLEHWMTKLPDKLKKGPFVELAIPGSHDSFTWEMSANSDVSPDADDIVKALSHLGPLMKGILLSWSATQIWPAKTQLENGIRYFDLRIATKDGSDDYYIVHSLYSQKLFEVYDEINTFLEARPQEVVILDHQHFYYCDGGDHDKITQQLKTAFGGKILPCEHTIDIRYLTLEKMNKRRYQVIVIYRDDKIVRINNLLYASKYFPTPWPDTTSQEQLFNYLDEGLKKRDEKYGYVSQCVLTPDSTFILSNLKSSLKEKCAEDLQKARNEWIAKQTPGPGGANIFIADYVDMLDSTFAKTVININQKIL